ncbi:protocadherin-16 isoform X4 [Ahaetulla prasina]|uniref:protocadherin-16 isoform X4 n=1 Tax=Ahaetulla prasina TaxID=499056 RepID=UPI00264900A6|nr:protocadherin-16 isoform X4 [Ahaetulla prasina]
MGPLALVLLLLLPLLGGRCTAVPGTLDLHVDEEMPAGTIIGDISAGLPTGTTSYMYFISAQEGSGVATDLEIDENTGIIKTAGVLDHESRDHYSFIAVTPDGATVEVNIQVNDINDHAPIFPKQRAALFIPEHTHTGSHFPLDPAFDADSNLLSTQGYAIKAGNVDQTFQLETRRGPNGVLHPELVVSSILDREVRSAFTLLLEAYDGGSPPRSSQMTLEVSVQDINDNVPAFNQSRYHTLIPENLLPGSSILQVFAWDADEGDNGAVVYEINRRQSDPEQFFTIDASTGVIKLNKGLDYELRKVHELVVQARDKAIHPEVSTTFVTIQVRDYNDNQPTMTIIFLSEDGSPRISEGAQPGQFVARISVSDPDYGEYANVNVSLEGGEGKFALTTKDNIIYLICVDQMLDREERDSYELRVTATDAGTPPLRAESAFVLQVMDINDNPPLFDAQEYEQSVPEVVYPGSFVLQVTARDKDQGPNGEIRYSILHSHHSHSHWFAIDPATGIVTTASALDYETDPQPRLTVLATDRGKPPLSSTTVVLVNLQDINDNEPVFESNFYNISLKENVSPGTCFLQITATDADSGSLGSISYALGTGLGSLVPSAFLLGEKTGQLCTAQGLDRDEGPSSYDFTVTAVDGGGLSSTAYVKVFLEDVNDNAPAFYPLEYAASISTQSQPGSAILRVTAHDKDDGLHGRVAYRIANGNMLTVFAINPDTGVISLRRPLTGKANLLVQLEVEAEDGGGLAAQPTAQVNISIVAGIVSPPSFERVQYYFTVPEDTRPGSSVGSIHAYNAQGELSIRKSLDREQQSSYQLQVLVQDGGTPPRSTTGTIYVTVLDENDNAPAFLHVAEGRELLLQVLEDKPAGLLVAALQAKDPDKGENGTVFYKLSGAWAEHFSLHESTGELRTANPLQQADQGEYLFTVTASDRGATRRSTAATLRIQVVSSSHVLPRPETTVLTFYAMEDLPPGSSIGSVAPLELPPHGQVTYMLVGGNNGDGFFVVDTSTGEIYLAQELDYEAERRHTLHVSVEDSWHGYPSQHLLLVEIHVQDSNDHSPTWPQDPITVVVSESATPDLALFTFQALDGDGPGPNSQLRYSLLRQDILHPIFQLDAVTGELSLQAPLDRESQSAFLLAVMATDQARNVSQRHSAAVTTHIFIMDENDNAPEFLSPPRVNVPEDQPTGFLVLQVVARDRDMGENGRVSYLLRAGNPDGRFHLNPSTGALSIVRGLDREEVSQYNLTVMATDHGSPRHSTTQLLLVQVLDVNDETPTFEKSVYEGQVSENLPAGVPVLQLHATDQDLGTDGQVTYGGIVGDDFMIDPHTGLISTLGPLDHEERAEHLLTVYAQDGGLPPRQAKATVRVLVLDENDHAPVFQNDAYSLAVPENQSHQKLLTLRATDHDAGDNGRISYSLAAGDPEEDFALDPLTGQLSTVQGLDRERKATYMLTTQACDNGSPARCASTAIQVQVLDLNDNTPHFMQEAYTTEVPEDLPVGAPVLQLKARDPDEGNNGQISYFLANESLGAFQVEPQTGRLYSTQPLDRERQAIYHFLGLAVDSSPSAPRSASAAITVTVQDVNDHVPSFPLSPLTVTLPRHTPPKRVVATLHAEDHDAGANASILYRFAAPAPAFAINTYTGAIQLLQPLGSLSQRQRTLFVLASDLGQPPLSSIGVVVIHLQDESHRGVHFPRSTSDVVLPENAAPGTLVLSTPARHTTGSSGQITYSILSGNENGAFRIQADSGAISVSNAEGLDFELQPRLRLVLQAESPASFSFMAVTVNLQDVNDNQPRFQLQNYVAFIGEAQGYDLPVIQVVANDLDQGPNGQVVYRINQTQPMDGLYRINAQTGAITTAAILDREIWAQTRLVLTATDRGHPPLVGSATLTVVVMDLNDNSPTIPAPWEVRVAEDTLLGTEITMVTGNDVDCGPQLIYALFLDSSNTRTFSILPYGGHIVLTEPLDYEQRSHYTLTVRASDSQHETEANLTVLVEDVNDNAPTFGQALYQVLVPEQTPAGTSILTLSATDLDSGTNGEVTYQLLTASDLVAIHASNGTLFTTQCLNLELERPTLDLVVEACDKGLPSLSAWASVQIQVLDVNDHRPQFLKPQYNASVTEDLRPGTILLILEATDADVTRDNAALDYTIVSGNSGHAFQLESHVGEASALVLIEPLDFESVALYNLTVAVADRGVPQHSAIVPVVLTVLDVNDNPPVFGRSAYRMAVSESTMPGTELLRVAAHDPDLGSHGQVHYSISSGDPSGLFQLHPSSGTLRLVKALDCEKWTQHSLVIQASDGAGGHFALASVAVEVKDVNDNLPYFPIDMLSTSLRENLPPGSLVTTIRAVDPDVGIFGELHYAILQAEDWGAFDINSSSGELHSRLPFDYERSKAFQLLVQAMDAGNGSATVTVRVLVTGEDEYDPVFLSSSFHFDVPEGAHRGQSIGHVTATDEDEGPDGVVLYALTKPSPFFEINQTSGILYLRMDSQAPSGGPTRSEPRQMVLEVQAHSPLRASRSASTQVTIDVTHTAFGLVPDLNLLLVIAVAASLSVVVVLAAVAIVLALLRSQQGRSRKEADLAHMQSGSLQKLGHADPALPGGDCLYHEALPGYGTDSGGAYTTRGGSLDPSHSSGRGSAEAAEDDEIRMINECPRMSSVTSSLQEHLVARGPDSGIQTDADRLSDISCEPATLDATHWFKNRKGPSLLLPGQTPQLYRDDGGSSGAYLGSGCGLSVSSNKDYSFPEDGKPCVDGSLTAIVASDEELRGSYNWDYLLNWCPQFQPLASVFTEIARLKDESSLRKPFPAKPKPRIDPPPLITSVAHPGAKSVPPKPAVGRAFPHLSSLRRSPISHEGSLSSAAMSPSFSPSLSPLAARSPMVSPFGVSQGPTASSTISIEHSLEAPEEAELRI